MFDKKKHRIGDIVAYLVIWCMTALVISSLIDLTYHNGGGDPVKNLEIIVIGICTTIWACFYYKLQSDLDDGTWMMNIARQTGSPKANTKEDEDGTYRGHTTIMPVLRAHDMRGRELLRCETRINIRECAHGAPEVPDVGDVPDCCRYRYGMGTGCCNGGQDQAEELRSA